MKIKLAERQFDFPSPELGQLRDSTELKNNGPALLDRLNDDGYIFIRGLHPRDTVLKARRAIFEFMSREGNATLPGTDPIEGRINPDGKNVGIMGRKGITHHPDVLAVLEGKPIFDLFTSMFQAPALTFDYKWMRAVGNEGYTGAHYDVVYMGRGSGNLYTVWTPIGDITLEEGPLTLCQGSHKLPGFAKIRETYGKMDVDRDHVTGWFSNDPLEITGKFGGQWLTSEFKAGDVLLFTMFTMHMSLTNTTKRYRLSTDTRFQPAADPVDDRWVGDNPKAHYGWFKEGQTVTMADARAKWGV